VNALSPCNAMSAMPQMSTTFLREADLYGLLRAAIAEAGSQDAWARAAGLAPSFVSDTLAARDPSATACWPRWGCAGWPATS
jgi:uncharacterized membrane protein YhhN